MFVQPGRVAYVNYGEDYGKALVIADVVDQHRVLVDGPDFPRTIYPMKRLTLTKLRMDLARGARRSTVLAACKKFDMTAKWQATAQAKKLAQRKTRAELTDLQRFEVMLLRKRRSFEVRKLVKKSISKK